MTRTDLTWSQQKYRADPNPEYSDPIRSTPVLIHRTNDDSWFLIYSYNFHYLQFLYHSCLPSQSPSYLNLFSVLLSFIPHALLCRIFSLPSLQSSLSLHSLSMFSTPYFHYFLSLSLHSPYLSIHDSTYLPKSKQIKPKKIKSGRYLYHWRQFLLYSDVTWSDLTVLFCSVLFWLLLSWSDLSWSNLTWSDLTWSDLICIDMCMWVTRRVLTLIRIKTNRIKLN